jgi:hypothetical protein
MIQLSDLIEALRCELQQYGEMLARFDDAEAYLSQDTAEETLSKAATLHDQEATIDRTVRRRGQVQRRLARYLGLHEDVGLLEIIPLMPLETQVLVQALMEENMDLSVRVGQRANLNRPFHCCPIPLVEGCFAAA